MKFKFSAAIRPGRLALLGRYCAASAVSTATSLTVLGLLVWSAPMGAAMANVVATLIGTVPSFELNRRWVWSDQGKRSVTRQVAPFVTLSLIGLVLSTLAVHTAAIYTDNWPPGPQTVAVEAANISAYGFVWVVQFLLLDRVLFARRKSMSLVVAQLSSPPELVDQGCSVGSPKRTGASR